jgi:hypothetical protein
MLEEYYITNMYCAAWLRQNNIDHIRITRNSKGKVCFHYINTESLHNAINDFYDNPDNVSLRKFITNLLEIIREVKKRSTA